MIRRKCVVCKKEFWAKESHVKKGWGNYCSKECQFKGQLKGKWIECDYCGKDIYRTPRDFRKSESKRFFCSVRCHCAWENKNRRCGENSPKWLGGKSVYRKYMKKYNIIEKCNRCGFSNKRVLVVHHRDGNRRNNYIDNLEWLCRNCHYIVHL